MAFSFSAVESFLVEWVAERTQLTVIWANQNAPSPALPYVYLDWVSDPASLILSDLRWDEDSAKFYTNANLEFSVSVSILVDAELSNNPDQNARALAYSLRQSLHQPGIFETFRGANLAVQDVTRVLCLDEVHKTEYINRAVFDLLLRSSESVLADVDSVGSVTMEATLAPGPATESTITED